MSFEGAKIVLGISGSIAAYKAVYLGRELVRRGAEVRVAMTKNAAKFVTPLTFRAALSCPVGVDEFEDPADFNMQHISWSKWADIIVIAPATANIIAKCAGGIADDFLSTTILAANSAVLFVPAMNSAMFLNPATQRNIKILRQFGHFVMQPDSGNLACGESGAGRFPEIEKIIAEIETLLSIEETLTGRKILVTAGPTREYIDSVRFISNPSTGKMGYAIAEMAAHFGAETTLISGPVEITPPYGVRVIYVTSAEEMYNAVMSEFGAHNIVIMASAVADYTPTEKFTGKIKKTVNSMTIELTRTRDILAELGKNKGDKILVGFALETDNLIENAKDKLLRKNLDIIFANLETEKTGFSAETNAGVIIDRNGNIEEISLLSKRGIAVILLKKIQQLIEKRAGHNK